MKKLTVHVWSDIACPWCYVGKRRLETALSEFEHGDQVDVVWRAFELDPSAPPSSPEPVDYAARLAKKYRSSVAQAEAMIERMTEVAAIDGLDFRFNRIKPGNTFDAHRLIHFAREHDKQGALKERILKAYMTEGQPISDHAVLTRLATEVGLDPTEVATVLASGACADDVRADEAEASSLGIRGVPFFVVNGRYGISGAQPAEVIFRALERAWRGTPSQPNAEGAACGPAGCD